MGRPSIGRPSDSEASRASWYDENVFEQNQFRNEDVWVVELVLLVYSQIPLASMSLHWSWATSGVQTSNMTVLSRNFRVADCPFVISFSSHDGQDLMPQLGLIPSGGIVSS